VSAPSKRIGPELPTVRGAVQALRRLGGEDDRGTLEAALADSCFRNGHLPPIDLVRAAVEAAVAAGALVADGQRVRMGGAT
jgi:hypothetical protein